MEMSLMEDEGAPMNLQISPVNEYQHGHYGSHTALRTINPGEIKI
jgi:hypothetical protein